MTLRNIISNSNILMVGAGGIGCELLKNLILSGFKKITLIDLDTIDISNLNRQFLFQKEHVGKSKAQVAKESALQLNPNAEVIAYHDSIMNTKYDVGFFKKFNIVMNALDNRAARSHVNRMCLATDIPLIESGTAGYLGQVHLIKKQMTECYDCQPKDVQKSYPGCTIRNTPSEISHCIVWAKHLFNQLFGESDPDQDVSPDTEDPEATGDAGKVSIDSEAKSDAIGGIGRKSTRVWVEESSYNPDKLLHKFFNDDIKYLLSMANLWKKRTPPNPLDVNNLPLESFTNGVSDVINEQQVWSIRKCVEMFRSSLALLQQQIQSAGPNSTLVWDKDDETSLDFVTSAANIRAFIFHIPTKSKFDIKAMAGNIIPAIATTNAIIAGLIVFEAYKILNNRFDLCRVVYLNRFPNNRKKLLIPNPLDPPNEKCYVCSGRNEIAVALILNQMTVKTFEEKVLKGALGMVAPDVEIDDGKGTILISSEEGETEENNYKALSEFNIASNTRLKCDDFLQEYNLIVNIIARDKISDEKDFEIVGDVNELTKTASIISSNNGDILTNGNQEDGDVSHNEIEDDDDLFILEDEDESASAFPVDKQNGKFESQPATNKRKRRLSTGDNNHDLDAGIVMKKKAAAAAVAVIGDDDELMIIN